MAALAIPLGVEVLKAAAVVGAFVAYLRLQAMSKKERDRAQRGATAQRNSPDECPPHRFSSNEDYVAQCLGINRRELGNRIHQVKQHGLPTSDGKNIRRNPDIEMCVKCGACFFDGEDIGSLR